MSTTEIITPDALDKEDAIDQNLRPTALRDYVGQDVARQNIGIMVEASKIRGTLPDHVLLHGPPGLGKTTLAHIIANELSTSIHTTSGPALERSGDVVALVSSLPKNSILFIDEIHRLRRTLEEVLYSAMEDGHVDVVMGKGPTAKSVRLTLPPFMLIGATTRIGALSGPLRDRFGTHLHLDFYTTDELSAIVRRTATTLNLTLEPAAIRMLAERSRKTPRIVNRLLRRVHDYVTAHALSGPVTAETVRTVLAMQTIDDNGLTEQDRRYLAYLTRHQHRPVGLTTLAAALSEELDTITDVIEPYLLQEGYIQRTPQGRIATPHATGYNGTLPLS